MSNNSPKYFGKKGNQNQIKLAPINQKKGGRYLMNNAHNAPLKAPTKSVISRDKKTSNNMADRHSTDA